MRLGEEDLESCRSDLSWLDDRCCEADAFYSALCRDLNIQPRLAG